MASTLDVVNECLATLGEVPLNTLSEPHEFKASAQRYLARANRRIQSPGYWFNTERATLSPAPLTGHITLAGDAISWRSGSRARDTLTLGAAQPWIVQRGTRLYDTRNRTYVFTENAIGELIREIPFEDLPPVVNDLVAAEAVLRFQSSFDADNSKRQELAQSWALATTAMKSENIRQAGVNLIASNYRLQRIKSKSARYN
jgi:hypothetical protein